MTKPVTRCRPFAPDPFGIQTPFSLGASTGRFPLAPMEVSGAR